MFAELTLYRALVLWNPATALALVLVGVDFMSVLHCTDQGMPFESVGA